MYFQVTKLLLPQSTYLDGGLLLDHVCVSNSFYANTATTVEIKNM